MITAGKVCGNYIIEIELNRDEYKVRVYHRNDLVDYTYFHNIEDAIKWGEDLVTKQNEKTQELKKLEKQGWRVKEE